MEEKFLWRISVNIDPALVDDADEYGSRQFYAWLTLEERDDFRQELKERGYSGVRFTWQKGPFKP